MKKTIRKRINVEVEVNNCPYCNSEDINFVKYNVDNFGTVFQVCCKNCRTHGAYGKNKEEAVNKWNERKESLNGN